MMHSILIWMALALAGTVDADEQAPDAVPTPAPTVEPIVKPAPAPLVGLHQVFADPLDYLGRRVRVVFQVHSAPAQWNPYLTRFGTAEWAAVKVWSEHQFLWDVREYEQPLGLVFAPRGGAAHTALLPAREFSRFEATIRVDQVFLGRPWIAILELEQLRAETGRGSILHASRALALMASGEWRLAIDDLSRAGVPELPPAAQAELDRLAEFCEDRLAAIRARNRSQR